MPFDATDGSIGLIRRNDNTPTAEALGLIEAIRLVRLQHARFRIGPATW